MSARATVPQHLELDEVVAWGLGATDLLCVAAGCAAGWWVASAVDAALLVRLGLGLPPFLASAALTVIRVDDRQLRSWIATVGVYLLRRRILTVGQC